MCVDICMDMVVDKLIVARIVDDKRHPTANMFALIKNMSKLAPIIDLQ